MCLLTYVYERISLTWFELEIYNDAVEFKAALSNF